MAKNKNGQTVKNKKYYKNKSNPNYNSKKKKKNKSKKIENNVSIIVDNQKESLNYNIVEDTNIVEEEVKEEIKEEVKVVDEEPIEVSLEKEEDVVPKIKEELKETFALEEETDYRAKRAKLDRKIKTNFKEEIHEEQPTSNKKKKKKKKNKSNEEKPIVVNIEAYNNVLVEKEKEKLKTDDSVELPLKISKDVYDQNKIDEDKSLVDKAFEDNDKDVGDIDKPAIFKNINVEESSFRGFVIKLIVLLVILILSIFFVINFSAKYMASTTTQDVGYFESSDIDYKLCANGKCNNNINYITKYINTVNIKFNYDLSFDEKINFEGKYNIIAKFSINDNKTGDILYTENKEIKKDTFKEKNIQDFEIKDDAILLLDDYRKFLNKYNKDRNAKYTGEVRVNLYVDGVNGKKRVSSLLVPLQERAEVEKTIISYQAGDASIEDDGSHYGKVYVYLIIVSLVLVVAASIGVVLLLSGAEDEEE